MVTAVNYGLKETKQDKNIRYWTYHEDEAHYAIVLIGAAALEKLDL